MSFTRAFMATLPLGAFFAPVVSAQTEQITWAAVAFISNGETLPELSAPSDPLLTSLGASQLYSAGGYLRNRYIVADSPTTNISGTNIGYDSTVYYGINGISKYAADPAHITSLSTQDQGVMGSANSFTQGLYPPLSSEADDLTELASGSALQFPLNGYQYVQTFSPSSMDWSSLWVDGNNNCPNRQVAATLQDTSSATKTLMSETNSYYQSLNSALFAPLQLAPSLLTITNAYPLYEYASYQYNHNTTVSDILSINDLTTLYLLASENQFAQLGNLSAPNPGVSSYTEILAISGKTFANKVLTSLSSIISNGGSTTKLSLLFGTFEPFLSFFSLSGLSTGTTGQAEKFQTIPLPGSMIVFELFSPASSTSNSTTMPSADNLWVRFLFRNGTSPTEGLVSYPLFGRGNSESDMRWVDFLNGMQGVVQNGGGIADWCVACSSSSFFCEAYTGNTGGTEVIGDIFYSSNGGLSAPIAGVIGALVTLAVTALVLLGAILLGGLRFTKMDRRLSAIGGFKGAEKMKSDVDVSVIKNDAGSPTGGIVRHERVGSWELAESPIKEDGHGDMGSLGRIVSTANYDDDEHSIIDTNGVPVMVHERV